MSSAEYYSPKMHASVYKQTPNHLGRIPSAAETLLTNDQDLLAHFYFSFYQQYCDVTADTGFDSVLSLGEIDDTIVIARRNDQTPYNDPAAYLIKQYNLTSQAISDWDVADIHSSTGRGDAFEYALILHERDNNARAANLFLTNKGNAWSTADQQKSQLRSALLLPHTAMYDSRTTEKELRRIYEELLCQQADKRQGLAKRFGECILTTHSAESILTI